MTIKPSRDYTNEEYFNCYSRKLMYYLGLYGINYLDKYYDENGRPMWRFENNERLRELLATWDDFKKTI